MVLYYCCSTRPRVYGKCGHSCLERIELIKLTGSQFGGVGVNCHQPLGSHRLICPYDPGNPFPYRPLFEASGDQTYSGEFECEPSDSIQAEGDPIPDATQLLSPDQISQIEDFWTYSQYEPIILADDTQIAEIDEIDEILPISESVNSLQLLSFSPNELFEENAGGSQMDPDVFSNMADNLIDGQNIPSDESSGFTLFSDGDFNS